MAAPSCASRRGRKRKYDSSDQEASASWSAQQGRRKSLENGKTKMKYTEDRYKLVTGRKPKDLYTAQALTTEIYTAMICKEQVNTEHGNTKHEPMTYEQLLDLMKGHRASYVRTDDKAERKRRKKEISARGKLKARLNARIDERLTADRIAALEQATAMAMAEKRADRKIKPSLYDLLVDHCDVCEMLASPPPADPEYDGYPEEDEEEDRVNLDELLGLVYQTPLDAFEEQFERILMQQFPLTGDKALPVLAPDEVYMYFDSLTTEEPEKLGQLLADALEYIAGSL